MTTTIRSDPHPRRWWVLAALCLVLLAVGLDLTALNVALPAIASDLDADTSQLQWVLNSYIVVLAALLLPVGQLGDRFGRRRFLLLGLMVFGAASLVCAFAPSAGVLIGGRALLGVGAALLNTLGLAILVDIFPRHERPRAIAIQSLAVAGGIPLGPLLGSVLVDQWWWGAVFLLNVPLVLIAGVTIFRLVPESRAALPPRIDIAGVGLAVGALGGVSFGLIHGGEHGWLDPVAGSALAVGLVLVAGFVLQQRRAREPLAPLELLRDGPYAWGAVLSAAVQLVVFGVMFVLPQYLQAGLGSSELMIGIQLLPFVVAMLIGVQIGAVLRARIGVGAVMSLGFTAVTAGLVLGAFTQPGDDYLRAAGWTALIGAGFGVAMPPEVVKFSV